MSPSEMFTITVLFHLSGLRTFKYFYLFYVQLHLKDEFPKTVSYNSFVELMKSNIFPLTLYVNTCFLGSYTVISFLDSTPIRICKSKRIRTTKFSKVSLLLGNQLWVGFMDSSFIL